MKWTSTVPFWVVTVFVVGWSVVGVVAGAFAPEQPARTMRSVTARRESPRWFMA
jgi:purine-cytosine permease-like protein